MLFRKEKVALFLNKTAIMKHRKGMSMTGRRHSLTEREIFAAIEQFEAAGNISIKEFSTAFQVSEATYYNWRKRYKSRMVQKEPAVGFIPVDLSEVQGLEERSRIFAEFRGIVFYQRVEASYLKSLL
jgi:hypothetical protein